MYGFCPVVRSIARVCALVVAFAICSWAQVPGGGPSPAPSASPSSSPSTPPAPLVPASAAPSSDNPTPAAAGKAGLSILVRAANGANVDTLAVVTLFDASGQTLTSKTTADSLASFVPLRNGSYIIDVDAPGFAKSRMDAKVTTEDGEQLLIITLKPDTGSGVTYALTSNVQLAPKPQKEFTKGLDAYRGGKLDEAIKHLEVAQHMVPKEAEIPAMLGMVYEKKGEMPTARKYWEQSIQLDPKHLSALLPYGDSLLRQKDLVGARNYLEMAVEAGPTSWRAHALLAAVLMQQKSYAEAVSHAERAVDLGKGDANSARLTLGQSLAYQNQNKQAITALEAYIAGNPSPTMAEAARNMITRLQNSAAGATDSAAAVVDLSTGSATGDTADIPLTEAALHWLPPDVDSAVPAVEPGVTCSLDDVLKKTSARVQELPAVVDRYTATEVLHHEDVNNAGFAEGVADISFNYLASVRDIKNEKYGEALDVQEYRNGSTGTEMFPNHEGSVGLPSIVLIFHPLLISDFEMKCEGLSRARGGFAWQVYFRQRGDKESRIRRYRIAGHVYPIALKGRAWIDANTFEIVRLETDLREAHPELKLNAEHLIMDYGPVRFKSRNEQLWLPVSAEYYAIRRGKRFHRRHTFTNYILFSVEDKQKISEPPKEKAAAATAPDKNSDN
jgi:tetratricopeptide (TPR) repeat protein